MAAPYQHENVRIKVCFDKKLYKANSVCKKVHEVKKWAFISYTECPQIEQVAQKLISRFDQDFQSENSSQEHCLNTASRTNPQHCQIWLDGVLIPQFESSRILRDGDEVTVSTFYSSHVGTESSSEGDLSFPKEKDQRKLKRKSPDVEGYGAAASSTAAGTDSCEPAKGKVAKILHPDGEGSLSKLNQHSGTGSPTTPPSHSGEGRTEGASDSRQDAGEEKSKTKSKKKKKDKTRASETEVTPPSGMDTEESSVSKQKKKSGQAQGGQDQRDDDQAMSAGVKRKKAKDERKIVINGSPQRVNEIKTLVKEKISELESRASIPENPTVAIIKLTMEANEALEQVNRRKDSEEEKTKSKGKAKNRSRSLSIGETLKMLQAGVIDLRKSPTPGSAAPYTKQHRNNRKPDLSPQQSSGAVGSASRQEARSQRDQAAAAQASGGQGGLYDTVSIERVSPLPRAVVRPPEVQDDTSNRPQLSVSSDDHEAKVKTVAPPQEDALMPGPEGSVTRRRRRRRRNRSGNRDRSESSSRERGTTADTRRNGCQAVEQPPAPRDYNLKLPPHLATASNNRIVFGDDDSDDGAAGSNAKTADTAAEAPDFKLVFQPPTSQSSAACKILFHSPSDKLVSPSITKKVNQNSSNLLNQQPNDLGTDKTKNMTDFESQHQQSSCSENSSGSPKQAQASRGSTSDEAGFISSDDTFGSLTGDRRRRSSSAHSSTTKGKQSGRQNGKTPQACSNAESSSKPAGGSNQTYNHELGVDISKVADQLVATLSGKEAVASSKLRTLSDQAASRPGGTSVAQASRAVPTVSSLVDAVEQRRYWRSRILASDGKESFDGYSKLTKLPEPGTIIAYKTLELSADYAPEVSGYKLVEVVGVNAGVSPVELEVLGVDNSIKRTNGRFEMDNEEEGSDSASACGSVTTVCWSDLIDAKFIISLEKPGMLQFSS